MHRYEYGKWLISEGVKGISIPIYTRPLTVANKTIKNVDSEFENFTPSLKILSLFPPDDRQSRSRLKRYGDFLEQFEPNDSIYTKKYVDIEFDCQKVAIPIKANYTNPDNPEKWIPGWDSLQVADIVEILSQNESVQGSNDSELQRICDIIGKTKEIGLSAKHTMHLFEQLRFKLGRKKSQSQEKQPSIVNELQQLANLKTQNLLTDEEFKLAKAKLLGE